MVLRIGAFRYEYTFCIILSYEYIVQETEINEDGGERYYYIPFGCTPNIFHLTRSSSFDQPRSRCTFKMQYAMQCINYNITTLYGCIIYLCIFVFNSDCCSTVERVSLCACVCIIVKRQRNTVWMKEKNSWSAKQNTGRRV